MNFHSRFGFKCLTWILVFLLAVTSMPFSAKAAGPQYFYLDNVAINNSTKDKPFVYNQPMITITGTYTGVNKDTMTVKVEQILNNNTVVDGYTTGVTALDNKKFEARSLVLFNGLNRITFSGISNNITYSNEFYILYDSSPFLSELLVLSGKDPSTPLNSGFGVVVSSPVIFLEGKAPNANRVIVNGLEAQVQDDGKFYSTSITLNKGKNDLVIEIINNTDRVLVQRTVYYYDKSQAVYDVALKIGSNTQPLSINGDTTIPIDFNNSVTATVEGKVLLPYVPGASSPSVTITVYDEGNNVIHTGNLTLANPQPVYIGTGQQVAYQYFSMDTSDPDATFTIPSLPGGTTRNFVIQFDVQMDTQSPYGTYDLTETDPYSVIFTNSNIPVVEEVEWLLNYDENQPVNQRDRKTKLPLNGATLSSPNIYVLVTSNKPIANPNDVIAYYETFGGNYIPLVPIADTSGEIGPNQYIYRINQIPTGTQSVSFNIKGTADMFKKRVQFTNASGPHVTLENIYDGMIIERDKLDDNLVGYFHNVPQSFNPTIHFFIMLNSVNQDMSKLTLDPTIKNKFSYPLKNNADLSYGENTLVLAFDLDGDKDYEYEKTVRFYVLDADLPVINQFKPVIKAETYASDDLKNADSSKTDYEKLFNNSVTNVNGIYYTQNSSIDLLMDFTNAKKVELIHNGKTIFSYDDIDDNDVQSNGTFSGFPTKTNKIDENAGLSEKFIDHYYNKNTDRMLIRIRDINLINPGSLVFTLKIESDQGSKAEQRLEIVKEVAPYRIISPVANTGDGKIVVNKNFVTLEIEADGADYVKIGKTIVNKVPNSDPERFVYVYEGLKENKPTKIEFTVVRDKNEVKGVIEVFYANSNVEGAEYREELSNKHKVFNGALQLEFPRGTVLRTKQKNSKGVYELFEGQKLLFGIADPDNGAVEKVFDDGTKRNIRSELSDRFANRYPSNFTLISPVYWIHGGLSTGPNETRVHGLNPYDEENYEFVYSSVVYGQKDRTLVPTQRGKLTIQFDPNLRLAADHTVTVFHFNENGEWENLGGVVNTKNNTITVPFDRFGYYAVMKLRYSFEDIRNHPWGKDILEAAYSKGLMNNLRYDEFGADDYTTRGEFTQMLVKALAMPLQYDDENTFFDVPPDSRSATWSYEYIETAARAGIVRGVETRIFAPNQRLTREQAAGMVARALELKLPKNDGKLLANLKKLFTDYDQIDNYAYPAVYAVYKEGLMLGRENKTSNTNGKQKPTYRFDPQANLTRAEAAAIVVRIMQQRKMLPDFLSGEQ